MIENEGITMSTMNQNVNVESSKTLKRKEKCKKKVTGTNPVSVVKIKKLMLPKWWRASGDHSGREIGGDFCRNATALDGGGFETQLPHGR